MGIEALVTPETIRELVVRMARDNASWSYG